jgi:glycosyltransferase involved in cell wall biosynthesis
VHPQANTEERRGPGSGLRIALVHDYLIGMRGADRTFVAMAELWPDAPIYTLLHDEAGTGGAFRGREIHTSYLDGLHAHRDDFRRLLPLFPRAAEHLPVQDYDLIISSSSAFAHGVRPAPSAVHVCYCHTPFRYAWIEHERALDEVRPWMRPALRHVLARVRRWDRDATRGVTSYVAVSGVTRDRIRSVWNRDSAVVHPPVDLERFRIGVPEDYLLVVTELVRHKRVELALEAARRAGRPIKVVGGGPELDSLRSAFGGSAEFLGRVGDEQVEALYAGALALVVPGVEEFGIAAVEAQAAGRPVIAAAAGGVLETVVPGVTGVLVTPDDVDELARAMRETPFDEFDPANIRAHTGPFSVNAFQRRFAAHVDHVLEAAKAGAVPAEAVRPARPGVPGDVGMGIKV